MTFETLQFLRNVCNLVDLRVRDENFRESALCMVKALDELDAEIAAAQPKPSS